MIFRSDITNLRAPEVWLAVIGRAASPSEKNSRSISIPTDRCRSAAWARRPARPETARSTSRTSVTHQQPTKSGNAASGGLSRGRKSSEMFAVTVLSPKERSTYRRADSFQVPGRSPDWLKMLQSPLASSTDLQIDCRFLAATALNLVLHDLSFVEGSQTSTFDSADVYKHVLAATLRLDEPITLRWVEPLHSARSHAGLLVEIRAQHASS